MTSDVGSNEINWSLIAKVQVLKNSLLLFFSENETMTLPSKSLNKEQLEFIFSKINANNIKLV
ncbi:MAG: YcxB family protein [Desulfobulbaceae bacterium]|nr:MAG: YcxB family protein [Desulfobulbaceae bacterium]